MPDIIKLFKKSEEKKRFKKSTYRPWNFMDQMDAEKEALSPSVNAVDSTEKKTTEKQYVSRKISNDFQTLETHNLGNNNIELKNSERVCSPNNNESNVDKIFRLYGYQKVLFFFIVERCFSRGILTTGAVCNNSLAELLGTSSRMVKTTIHRLVHKKLIMRENGKRGRGGFYIFSIDESIRAAFLEYKRLLVTEESSRGKRISNGNHIDINDTKLPKDGTPSELYEEWQNIDIEPLSDIGITKTHLIQIASQNKLSPEMVQDSIYAFAFDLKENNKRKDIKRDPVGFFMGILRRGGTYLPPGNYESPQARNMRLYTERMGQVEAKRAEVEKKAFDLAFNDWFNKLTDEQKIELLPEMFRHNVTSEKLGKSKVLETSARSHFEKEIWSAIKNKIEIGE